MSKKRNRHTEEFKREAVRLMLSRGERTVGDVAKSVGVTEGDLHLTIHLFFWLCSAARPSRIAAPGRMCSGPRRIVMDPGGPPATRGPM